MSRTPHVPPRVLAPPEVVVDDITTILGETPVLHRLRLVVPAGRATVLMGPSGVGKTTLIKHIVGLREPDAGTVRIGGHDVWALDKADLQEVRKGIGAMLGGHTLFSTSIFSSYSVLENLRRTLEAHGVPADEWDERALTRLRELHLEDYLDRTPEELPAHANKRLALARALVADAPFTVLDEIDVGLDAAHSAAMLTGLRTLRERTGCTLLITTHNLGLARSVADQLAIMVNGRIVAVGPPEEVLDGVESTEDFDRRFEFSDQVGPPRLADAEAAARRAKPEPERRQLSFDPQLLVIAVVAIVLVTAVFLVLRLFAPGTLALP